MKKIRKAAVIGSGVMGGGIAALLASAGVRTVMLDIVPPDLKDEQKSDPKARNRIVKQGLDNVLKASPALLMHPQDAERIEIGNLEDDFERLAECDWIIEVVVENLKVKKDLLQKIEMVRRPGTIVTTNTSGIPLKAMSRNWAWSFGSTSWGPIFSTRCAICGCWKLFPVRTPCRSFSNLLPNTVKRFWARESYGPRTHPILSATASGSRESSRPCS